MWGTRKPSLRFGRCHRYYVGQIQISQAWSALLNHCCEEQWCSSYLAGRRELTAVPVKLTHVSSAPQVQWRPKNLSSANLQTVMHVPRNSRQGYQRIRYIPGLYASAAFARCCMSWVTRLVCLSFLCETVLMCCQESSGVWLACLTLVPVQLGLDLGGVAQRVEKGLMWWMWS